MYTFGWVIGVHRIKNSLTVSFSESKQIFTRIRVHRMRISTLRSESHVHRATLCSIANIHIQILHIRPNLSVSVYFLLLYYCCCIKCHRTTFIQRCCSNMHEHVFRSRLKCKLTNFFPVLLCFVFDFFFFGPINNVTFVSGYNFLFGS